MLSTQGLASRLATGPVTTPITGKGYRANTLMARLSTRNARKDALERLCKGAERKPGWLYDARKDEGRALPCERMDAAISEGIASGYITPEVLADYFGELFAIYRAMMPGAAEATYLDTTRENAQALEAIAVARCNPTPENREAAARELLEAAVVSTAHAKQLQSGRVA